MVLKRRTHQWSQYFKCMHYLNLDLQVLSFLILLEQVSDNLRVDLRSLAPEDIAVIDLGDVD